MSGTYQRSDRVSDLVRREVGDILVRGELKGDFGFVTVTRVEMSRDLRNAKIYLSIMSEPEQRRGIFNKLLNSRGSLRKLLSQRLKLRYAPTIKLYIDESLDHAIRVQEILNNIHKEEK